ncbi:MAG: (d)CMP kinase [Turicibacter sp.]|nr:(d)CMP kinase [Turicibacter sp.]
MKLVEVIGMSCKKIIAIDGPAAAGKSTIAQKIAGCLGYVYIDTGAMFRALTLKALNSGLALEDEAGIKRLLGDTQIKLTEEKKVYLDGEEVTDAIRSPEVSRNVSLVASYKAVRDEMKARQIQYASNNPVVMDGRDIGTAVLPHADVKIFMTATVDVRAQRRYQENLKRNIPSDLEVLKKEIKDRDELDSTREHAPLVKAADAIEIDTSQLTIEEAVDKILKIVKGGD